MKFYLGWATALRVLFDKRIKKGTIKVPFLIHPFRIRHNDAADNQIFNEVILKRAYAGVDTNPNGVLRILDLGANIGLSAVSFLSEYPRAALAVVEPDTENFKLLNENIKPYVLQGREVHFYNTAVYNVETELFLEDPGVGSHGFRMVQGKPSNAKGAMSAVTINGLLTELKWDSVDIVKIDIEGAEKELFELNTEWLDKAKYVMVETHDRFKPDATKTVFAALASRSYKMKIWNQNLLFKLEHP